MVVDLGGSKLNGLTMIGMVCVTAALSLTLCQASLHDLLYPSHDGTDRIRVVTPLSLADVLTQTGTGNALVLVSGGPPEVERSSENMIQIAAQILQNKPLVFAKLTVGTDVTELDKEGLRQGGVYFIKAGRKIPFHGYRTHDVLITFIRKLLSLHGTVSVIEGKATKKAFDVMDCVRVVGYFTPGSPELAEFEQAAMDNLPSVPFFLITDPMVAPHFKMNSTGTVQIVQPFQKYGEAVPANPVTAADINNALKTQKSSVVRRITRDNVHLLETLPVDGVHVMAFFRRSSADGYQMDKMLRKMAKYGTNTTHTSVVTIDPEEFPALETHWAATLNISFEEPRLGLVNFSNHQSKWFNISDMMSQINSTDETHLLHDWLLAVDNGTYVLEKPTSGEPQVIADQAVDDARVQAEPETDTTGTEPQTATGSGDGTVTDGNPDPAKDEKTEL